MHVFVHFQLEAHIITNFFFNFHKILQVSLMPHTSAVNSKNDSRADFIEKKRHEREQRKARVLREASAIIIQVIYSILYYSVCW